MPAMVAAPESSAEESSDEEEAPVQSSLHSQLARCPRMSVLLLHSPIHGRWLSGKCLLIFMCRCFDPVPPAGTCAQAEACATADASHSDLRRQEEEEAEAGGVTELHMLEFMAWSSRHLMFPAGCHMRPR